MITLKTFLCRKAPVTFYGTSWDVKFAYNTEVLGDNGSFPSYY